MRFDTSIRFTSTMWDNAQEFAKQNNTDLSKILRLALHEYLEREGINSLVPLGVRYREPPGGRPLNRQEIQGRRQ